MYVTNISELFSAVHERKQRSLEIERACDVWIRKTYGINSYSSLKATHLAFLNTTSSSDVQPYGVLARQIASICVEDVACYLGCRLIGLRPITLQFVKDSFSYENHDKRARVKIPWISTTRKGEKVVQNEKIVVLSQEEIAMRSLDAIETKFGVPLITYHNRLRTRVFGSAFPCPDISLFHMDALKNSSFKPSYVFVEKNGKAVKTYVREGCDYPTETYIRPPAHWYYPLYLSWFLTGDMILLETYENQEGSVPEAKIMFERAMQQIESGTGFRPLILEIPPLTQDMLYCNSVFTAHNGVITLPDVSHVETTRLSRDIFRQIADAVIAFQ